MPARTSIIRKRLVLILVSVSFALISANIAWASYSEQSNQTKSLTVKWDNDTHTPFYVRIKDDHANWRGETNEATTFNFLQGHQGLYGISDVQKEFRIKKNTTDTFNLNHITLEQIHNNVPVYGADLKFHFLDNGNLSSIMGHHVTIAENLNTMPSFSLEQVYETAINHMRGQDGNPDQTLDFQLYDPQLVIYDPSLFAAVAPSPKLVWRFFVTSRKHLRDQLFYIDAQTNQIITTTDNIQDAKDREVYALADCYDSVGVPIYNEAGSIGAFDSDSAWIYALVGNAYDYFFNTPFSIDSYDDNGATIVSYGHYQVESSGSCHDTVEAGWSGSGQFMYYANGIFDQDIVAHEFTHGVVDNTADLENTFEQGALDESYADIFGTMAEFSLGDTDWTIGEDLPTHNSYCTTALRSLADPTAYTGYCDGSGSALPNHMNDYSSTPLSDDNGDVHTNSSIPNFAFYLLVEGGVHPTSSISVSGIGVTVAEQIYSNTLRDYLTTSSNFEDAYNATMQSCFDLNASDAATYPISYCESVFDAFAAVGINTDTSYVWADINATSSTSGAAPLAATFDAADSYSLGSTLDQYEWHFGDGTIASGVTASHTYTDPGTYEVTLIVTDLAGNFNTTTETITVLATGNISTSTWSYAYSPYIISGTVTIPSGETLTIDPGVVVKFADATGALSVSGTLEAAGTSSSHIVFTSYKDDDYAGDTNGDDSTTIPAAGDWNAIKVNNGGMAHLDYALVQYGGYADSMMLADDYASDVTITNSTLQLGDGFIVEIDANSNVTLEDNTIANSTVGIQAISMNGGTASMNGNAISSVSAYTVVLYDGTPTLENNTISDGLAGIYLDGNTDHPIITDNTITDANLALLVLNPDGDAVFSGNAGSDNDYNIIALTGDTSGTITLDNDNDLPYSVFQRLAVPSGATLTLDPGTAVKFYDTSSYLQIEGALEAVGTATNGIVFTSIKDDSVGGDSNNDGSTTAPAAGDWKSIIVASGGVANLDYATIQYGGAANTTYPYASNPMLLIDDNAANVVINHSTIQQSSYDAVEVDTGSTSVIRNSTITNTAGRAIYMIGGTARFEFNTISATSNYGISVINSSPVIYDNTLSNSYMGIYVTGASSIPLITSNTISNNLYGLFVDSGSPFIRDNSITNNTIFGVYHSTSPDLDVRRNWWGDLSGPYHATRNPTGTANAVSDYLGIAPWFTTDPSTDTTPPAEVTFNNQRKDVWVPTVRLNWFNPTDVDFQTVRIVRSDGTSSVTLTTTPAQTYLDTTVSYNTPYTYTFYTRDMVGNTSAGFSLASLVVANPAPHNLSLTAGDTFLTATWNPSPAPTATLAGYKVYYGTAPTALTNVIDVGNVTTANITGLTNGTLYYVTVTAYSTTTAESGRSNTRNERPHP